MKYGTQQRRFCDSAILCHEDKHSKMENELHIKQLSDICNYIGEETDSIFNQVEALAHSYRYLKVETLLSDTLICSLLRYIYNSSLCRMRMWFTITLNELERATK